MVGRAQVSLTLRVCMIKHSPWQMFQREIVQFMVSWNLWKISGRRSTAPPKPRLHQHGSNSDHPSAPHIAAPNWFVWAQHSQPPVLLQGLTCSWLNSTHFLTGISGRADSLHIGFITDWEFYFHKNYDFLVHPQVLKRKQINLNNWVLSNWFSDAFSLPQHSPALSVWATFAQIPELMVLLCWQLFFQWNASCHRPIALINREVWHEFF